MGASAGDQPITKADLAWQKIPIPLEWLAGFDEPAEANSLPDAFGDAYLYRHNAVYRNVRDAAVACGYRFSAADTPLWRQYQAFPLMSIERILTAKGHPLSRYRRRISPDHERQARRRVDSGVQSRRRFGRTTFSTNRRTASPTTR